MYMSKRKLVSFHSVWWMNKFALRFELRCRCIPLPTICFIVSLFGIVDSPKLGAFVVSLGDFKPISHNIILWNLNYCNHSREHSAHNVLVQIVVIPYANFLQTDCRNLDSDSAMIWQIISCIWYNWICNSKTNQSCKIVFKSVTWYIIMFLDMHQYKHIILGIDFSMVNALTFKLMADWHKPLKSCCTLHEPEVIVGNCYGPAAYRCSDRIDMLLFPYF